MQYSSNKNKKSYNKTIISNDKTSCLPSKVSFSDKNYDSYDNVIYLSMLKKQFDLIKSMHFATMYTYLISSSQDQIYRVLQKHVNDDVIDVYDVKKLLQQHPILNHLYSGQVLSWLVVTQKKLQCLVWAVSPKEIRIYNNIHNTFKEGIIRILTKSDHELKYTILFIGELNGTFINSIRSLGLEERCILDLVNAFQYQLDFKKLHQGDRFSILVSLKINNNVVQSKLMGARLYTSGKDYYIFRANNDKFYNREAVRLKGDFVLFPIVKPYRISSNFNLNRLNPVTGQISPHSGVDFAVPTGTPVLSVGDGEVACTRYSKVAGNYVVIKHNYQCITRYMHLKKVLVKPSQKVKQGDVIALSGNTGRSTGPHLHFEVWINHRPVNPLTANILNTEKLFGSERIKYLNQIHELIPKLSFN